MRKSSQAVEDLKEVVEKIGKSSNLKQKVDVLKLPYLVLAVSIILTLGITYIFYQSAISKDQIRFKTNVSQIQSSIESRIGLYTVLLKSGRGFIDASENLNRKDFANFVQSLELPKNYKGVQGIGYSAVFKPEEKQALIDKMKADGIADFKIFPEAGNLNTQSIIFLEPFNEQNRSAVGYDMSTEEQRKIALDKAADLGEVTATSQIEILQPENSPNVQKGFLIFLPVYNNETSPVTIDERRKSLRGFIYSPFRAGDFLEEVHSLTSIKDLKVKIYDGEPTAANLLVSSNLIEDVVNSPTINERMSSRNNLNVGGRTWTIEYETLPAFSNQSSLGWTPLIILGGIGFSLILFGLTYWETAARVKVQDIANELYESQAQKRRLLVKEKEAREAAESANRAKDEFISVISHELRTPLNAIAGWSRILRANHLTEDKRRTALDKIEKNLRHQTVLIDDMICYSEMVTDNSGLNEQEIVVSEIFNEAFDDIRPEAEKKNISLEKHNTLNGCVLTCDKEKIKTLFGNILSNAVKFTPEGGRVSADLNRSENKIHLSVEDNGVGIKDEFLPHIFEQFRQADSTTTRKHGGMGLGLAISKHIVKLYNGSIEALSKGQGKGTTIVVKIPLDTEDAH